jgi:glutathione S-transferase
MSLKLYAHPFSSYCQKVLIALYENETPFVFRMLAPGDAQAAAEHEALWPLKRIPVLVDEGRTVAEASIIIEHLWLYHPGPARLIPEDPRAALDVRMMDRFFDNYVMTPMQKIVSDGIRPPEDRDRTGVAEARAMLDTAYGWLDGAMSGRRWAAGGAFSLTDCAAAPPLFLRRLGSSDRRGLSQRPCLPAAAPGAPVLYPSHGRGAAVPAALPARRSRPRLTIKARRRRTNPERVRRMAATGQRCPNLCDGNRREPRGAIQTETRPASGHA